MRNRVLIKSALALFVCTMLIAAAGFTVNADIVWEPEDNFYKRHADECDYEKAELIANGPAGSVTVWRSPVSSVKVSSIKNGTNVGVSFTYTDKRGYKWSIVTNDGKTGWVPLDYLIVEPGIKNFYDKHEDEFEQANVDFIIPEGVEKVLFWSYPGSGELVNSRNVDSDDMLSVKPVYTDKDGRQWGYISYFQLAEGWICMSDPSNDQIPLNEEDAADVVTPSEPTVIIEPQPEGANIVILIAILVVVVGAGTFVLIRILFKRKCAKEAGVVDEANAANTVDAAGAATVADSVGAAEAADTEDAADSVGAVKEEDDREIK